MLFGLKFLGKVNRATLFQFSEPRFLKLDQRQNRSRWWGQYCNQRYLWCVYSIKSRFPETIRQYSKRSVLFTCSHCAHFLQIREVIHRLTWSFGRNKIPISYERIISCWPFFSSVPQAAFDKLALQRKKFVYKRGLEESRKVWVPSIFNDKSSLGKQLVRPCATHGATRTNDGWATFWQIFIKAREKVAVKT